MATPPRPRNVLRAWRLVANVALLAGILLTARAVAWRAWTSAMRRGTVAQAATEVRRLYDAFDLYYRRNGAFPNSYAPPRFEVDGLEPLRRRGYVSGRLQAFLDSGRADAYESPDDRGINQEFWIEMTLRNDPNVRFVVARSDDAPLAGGRWLDGAFVWEHGTLKAL